MSAIVPDQDHQPWDECLLQQWAAAMEVQGITAKTIRKRCGWVRGAAGAAGVLVTELTPDNVRDWLADYGNLPSAKNAAQAVQAFSRWLHTGGHIPDDPFAYVDLHRQRRGGPQRRAAAWRGPEELETLLASWVMWMRAAGWAASTIEMRQQIVRQYFKATGEPALAFTTDGLAQFIGDIENRNTKSTYSRALRAYHQWLEEYAHRSDDPMRRLRQPKEPKRVPHPISTASLQRLFASVEGNTRVMCLLATYAGLRVHEIAKIRGQDVDLDEQVLRVVGKGGVDARLPLHPEIAEAASSMPRRGYWFPSRMREGQPITPAAVTDRISRALAAIGVEGFRAHSMRHWHATALMNSGVDIRTVQTLMRHSTLLATEGYLQVVDGGRMEAILKLPVVSVRAAQLSTTLDSSETEQATVLAFRPRPERVPVPRWPGEHAAELVDGQVWCAQCGPLREDQVFWIPKSEGHRAPWCPLWEWPEPTDEQLAALDCPSWCDRSSHTFSRGVDQPVDHSHYRALGGLLDLGLSLDLDDGPDVRIHFTEGVGSDLEMMTAAMARQVAAELLNAADAAEAAR